jgi:hypothetical protein
VFPLVPGTKRPIPARGFHDATADEKTIEQWWRKDSLANIGIATGKVSGLLVVDLDVKHGKRGPEKLGDLEEENGYLPETSALTHSVDSRRACAVRFCAHGTDSMRDRECVG